MDNSFCLVGYQDGEVEKLGEFSSKEFQNFIDALGVCLYKKRLGVVSKRWK